MAYERRGGMLERRVGRRGRCGTLLGVGKAQGRTYLGVVIVGHGDGGCGGGGGGESGVWGVEREGGGSRESRNQLQIQRRLVGLAENKGLEPQAHSG